MYLVVLDSSCFLKYGTHAKFSKDKKIYGFPKGGIEALVNYISRIIRDGDHIIATFDSRTNRREIMSNYKSGRVKSDPEFGAQVSAIVPLLQKAGIQVEKHDGFEADDLIHHIVKQNYNKYTDIVIVTNDMDNSSNIDAKGKVRLMSPTKLSPNVSLEEYPYTVSNKDIVLYNTVIPYKIFNGDNSDDIGVFKSKTRKISSKELLGDYLTFAKEAVKNPQLFSEKVVFQYWLAQNPLNLIKEDVEELYKRSEVIHPKECELDLTYKNYKLDLKTYSNICTMFQLRDSAKYLKLPLGTLDDSMKSYLSKKTKELYDGVSSVDTNSEIKSSNVMSAIDIGYENIKEF